MLTCPMTNHAQAQRGIPEFAIEYLLGYGDTAAAGDGCEKIFMTSAGRKVLRRDIGSRWTCRTSTKACSASASGELALSVRAQADGESPVCWWRILLCQCRQSAWDFAIAVFEAVIETVPWLEPIPRRLGRKR